MRLFISLPLPKPMRTHLHGVGAGLAGRWGIAPDEARWVAAENLHVTIKFLGEVSDKETANVIDVLRGTEPVGALTLEASGLRLEPRRAPRVIAAEFAGDVGRIATLHQRCEAALQEIGFAPDRRKFWVHATLARLRMRVDGRQLGATLMGAGRWPGPQGVVRSFELVSSTLQPEGPLYVPLATFPLETT